MAISAARNQLINQIADHVITGEKTIKQLEKEHSLSTEELGRLIRVAGKRLGALEQKGVPGLAPIAKTLSDYAKEILRGGGINPPPSLPNPKVTANIKEAKGTDAKVDIFINEHLFPELIVQRPTGKRGIQAIEIAGHDALEILPDALKSHDKKTLTAFIDYHLCDIGGYKKQKIEIDGEARELYLKPKDPRATPVGRMAGAPGGKASFVFTAEDLVREQVGQRDPESGAIRLHSNYSGKPSYSTIFDIVMRDSGYTKEGEWWLSPE